MATTVFILTGSNLGDRERLLEKAELKLEEIPGLEVIATSAIYGSEAQNMKGENPPFLNQCVMVEYEYLPDELLDGLEAIERELGRKTKGQRLARTIDLDILLFGDEIISTDRLTVPHKDLLKRPFAMVPLLQLDPDIVHPAKKKAVAEFLTDRQRRKIVLYKDHVARIIHD